MVSIEQISDDPKYTIKKVCARTGIRPVTLRAWERRHEVLCPRRSENRYRLYSDRDIAILRWVKHQIDSGMTISSVVTELRSIQKNGRWPEVIPFPSDSPPIENGQAPVPPEQYRNELYRAMLAHDEATASELLEDARRQWNVLDLFTLILTPTLVQIGDAWYRGDIRIATEHFASAFVRGKLMTILQSLTARRAAPVILVGCAPGEHHEIGSLMLAVLLRFEGYRVEYMGADIPLDDLVDYSGQEGPAMILISAGSMEAALRLRHVQARLARQRPTPIFGYGGRVFITNPELREQIPGMYMGNDLTDAVVNVNTVLQRERGRKPQH